MVCGTRIGNRFPAETPGCVGLKDWGALLADGGMTQWKSTLPGGQPRLGLAEDSGTTDP